MGEHADDTIEGLSCSWCGIYFQEAHGCPVVCPDCAKDSSPRELKELGLKRANKKEA